MSVSLYVECWIEFGTVPIIVTTNQAYRFVIKQGKNSMCLTFE